MDFPTILKVAQTNKDFMEMCQRSFEKRNGGRKFVIWNLSDRDPPKFADKWRSLFSTFEKAAVQLLANDEIGFRMHNSDKSIRFDSVNKAFKTIRLFGNSIERLQLYLYRVNSELSELIIQYVNKYCSQSLIELEINVYNQGGDLAQHFLKPFEKLKHFSIWRDFPTSGQKRALMSSNQTFPALQSLHLHLIRDVTYFDCYFPHLKSFHSIYIRDDILKMNPQIQALGVASLHSENVEHIIRMPELKHLTFKFFYESGFEKEYVIENITNLTVTQADHPVRHVSFPNLQQLEVRFSIPSYHEWMNFFHEQSELRKFHLNHTRLIDNEFNDITLTMHNVEEVSISSDDGHTIPAASIIWFIETHQKLVKLCLETCNDANKEILKSRFSQDWTIKKYHNGLSFERNVLN